MTYHKIFLVLLLALLSVGTFTSGAASMLLLVRDDLERLEKADTEILGCQANLELMAYLYKQCVDSASESNSSQEKK